jgi:hypothetical protein
MACRPPNSRRDRCAGSAETVLAASRTLFGLRGTQVVREQPEGVDLGGVDRRTLHRWLVRYANEGLSALADRSCKPDRCPRQMPPHMEALIVSMRQAHPGWGPRTILSKLRSRPEQPPSRSAIYRCLVRHRLIEPSPRRRTAKD